MKPNIEEHEVLTEIINKEGDFVHVEQEEDSPKPISAAEKEQSFINQEEDHLRSAKVQMGEVREENERLKQLLSNIVKNYESLQMNVFQILQQEEAEKCKKTSPTHQVKEEKELISLSLGRSVSSNEQKKEEKKGGNNSSKRKEDANFSGKGLSLGLDCKFESNPYVEIKKPRSENSFEETYEEEATKIWPPNKVFSKTMRSENEETLQQHQVKKPRVSVRTRCDTPTMQDGCQWKKYGQKVAKGNPCPRAYYRCAMSPNCPVRKQVQRCVEDMSILITTYEGTHNHPLPESATAMAATTSAAVSMINSCSSTSQQLPGSLGSSISVPISSTSLPIGLNFSLPQNTRPTQLLPFPNTLISTSNSHPTLTLDLTTPTTTTTTHNHFNRSLNFSSPSPPPTSWNTHYPTYGSLTNKQQPIHQHVDQTNHMQITNSHQNFNPSQQSLTAEAITQATHVMIATNPMFQSVLAAAISNFLGSNSGIRDNINLGHLALNLKLDQSMGFNETSINSSSSNQSGNGGCGSSFLSKPPPSLSSQIAQGNLALFPSSLSLAVSRSASGSPANRRGSN